jgi:hypothetical protein
VFYSSQREWGMVASRCLPGAGLRLGTKEKSWRQTSEETSNERGMHATLATNLLDIVFHRPHPTGSTVSAQLPVAKTHDDGCPYCAPQISATVDEAGAAKVL